MIYEIVTGKPCHFVTAQNTRKTKCNTLIIHLFLLKNTSGIAYQLPTTGHPFPHYGDGTARIYPDIRIVTSPYSDAAVELTFGSL